MFETVSGSGLTLLLLLGWGVTENPQSVQAWVLIQAFCIQQVACL